MKKKYLVTMIEEFKYYIEVEADSEEEAEDLAWESDDFTSNNFDNNDAWVEQVEDMTESAIIWD